MIEVNEDAVLMTLAGGSCTSDVTLGSYRVWGGRALELNMKWQG